MLEVGHVDWADSTKAIKEQYQPSILANHHSDLWKNYFCCNQ